MTRGRLLIFKVGGKILGDPQRLSEFLRGFATLSAPKVLVHGGGVLAEELAARLGIPSEMHEGRRITSRAMRDLVTMVYGGGINKALVAELQSLGCDALGLTGADAGLIRAERRRAGPIDFGYVGDIREVNTRRLLAFLEMGLCPVIAPLSWDGELLNSNADSIAAHLAGSLAQDFEVQLVYGFEQPGVLEDLQNPDSLLRRLERTEYERLREAKIIARGMIAKLDEGFRAKAAGVSSVLIAQDQQGLAFARGEIFRGTELGLPSRP